MLAAKPTAYLTAKLRSLEREIGGGLTRDQPDPEHLHQQNQKKSESAGKCISSPLIPPLQLKKRKKVIRSGKLHRIHFQETCSPVGKYSPDRDIPRPGNSGTGIPEEHLPGPGS